MIQRRFCYLLCASLLIDAVASSAHREETMARQISGMNEPRHRTPRTIRRRNKYQYSTSVEEKPENARALGAASELNTSTDMDKFIHSPLGQDILSTVVTTLVNHGDQDNSILAEVLENSKFLWEDEGKVMNFREEKQHFPEQKDIPLSPRTNNDIKAKSSNSLTTVMIISPALLPSEEEYETDYWSFKDPRITSEHQVIRLNVNKNVQELLSVLSSVQPGKVHSRQRTVRSKQPRAFSERPEGNLNLGSRYNVEYTPYPTQLPPYSSSNYYEYPQDDYLDKEINEAYVPLDYDYHDDDIHFDDSDFSAANLGRIANHKYNQVRLFWDLFHHGWPLWLEK